MSSLFRASCHALHLTLARTSVGVAFAVMAGTAFAQSSSMSVTATVISKSNCKFDTKGLVLQFDPIDPTSSVNATKSIGGTVTCNGGQADNVFLGLSIDKGSYPSAGVPRMRHDSVLTEFLPYGLSINPSSATIKKNGSLAFTVDGVIQPFQFQNAIQGGYTDVVKVTVAP